MNPFAFFDCLSIGVHLQPTLQNVAKTEIHLFAYLSCLLSLYNGKPVSNWDYCFFGTKDGVPFSKEIEEVITPLTAKGLAESEDKWFFRITDRGIKEYNFLKNLKQNAQREVFIEGACSCILAFPIGLVREALKQNPELKDSATLKSFRQLLRRPGLEVLYQHFEVLNAVLAYDANDLMVPALVWLTYLLDITNSSELYPGETDHNGYGY